MDYIMRKIVKYIDQVPPFSIQCPVHPYFIVAHNEEYWISYLSYMVVY